MPNGSGAVATIAVAGSAVTIASSESFTVRTLTLDSDSASLVIDGTLDLAGRFALESGSVTLAGTIAGGTIDDGGGSIDWQGGTLSGVTYEGSLVLGGPGQYLTIAQGLTLTGSGGTGAGSLELTGQSESAIFDGTQTLDDAEVSFTGTDEYLEIQSDGSAATLTLGKQLSILADTPNTMVVVSGDGALVNEGSITATAGGYSSLSIGLAAFTNQGSVTVDNGDKVSIAPTLFGNAAGAMISVSGTRSTLSIEPGTGGFANDGMISVGAGATLYLEPDGEWGNAGTISLADGASVFLGGTFTTATLGTIGGIDNALAIDTHGVLDNAGAVFGIGPGSPFGTVTLTGTIDGGIITDAGLGFRFEYGGLEDVTYEGTLTIDAGAGEFASLDIIDGITLTGAGGTGPGKIDLTASNSFLNLFAVQSLDHASLIITGDSDTISLIDNLDNPTSLTLGKHFVLSVAGDRYSTEIIEAGDTDTLTNEGKISAATAHGSLTIRGFERFTNSGSLTVHDGDAVGLEVMEFDNAAGATVSVTGTGSTLGVGAFTNEGTITIGTGATLGAEPGTAWTDGGTINLAAGANLDLEGSFTTAELGGFSGSGYALAIEGTLLNTGAVLAIGSGGPYRSVFLDGTVQGGTIVDGGSGLTFPAQQISILQGVTYEGTLTLGGTEPYLEIQDSIVLTGAGGSGPGAIDVTGTDATLMLDGVETLDKATITLAGADGSLLIANPSAHTPLILGTGLDLVTGTGAEAEVISVVYGKDALENQGSIEAIGSAGGSLTIDAAIETFTNQGSVVVSNGDTLVIDSPDFTNFAGTTLTGGSYEVDAGSVLQLADTRKIVTDAATIILSGSGSAIQSSFASGSKEISIDQTLDTIAATGTLELLAGRNFAGTAAVTDDGSLLLGGGNFAAPSLTATVGATLSGFGTVAAPFTDAGAVTAKGGILAFTGTGDSFAGVLAGTEIDFSGGSDALDAGVELDVAKLGLLGTSTLLTLGQSVTYRGLWAQSGATLDLAANHLTIEGGGSFGDATVAGGGTLTLEGNAAIDGALALDGGVSLVGHGTLDDTGAITVGTAQGAELVIDKGGILDLDGDVGIGRGTSGASVFVNDGNVIKMAGIGQSLLDLRLVNSGSFAVETGTLTLGAAVTGSGSFTIGEGAALDFASASAATQALAFAGGDGTLIIDEASRFAATIGGFGSDDTIDLSKFRYHKSETVGFVENAADTQGTLTVTDGAAVIDVTLFGQYVAAGFGLASDGQAGSDISYVPPSSGSHAAIAAPRH